MYRASRTVAWNGVYGHMVQSNQTLAAGCSIALWLLQLLMLTPMDEFVFNLPRQVRLPEVYVDDASLMVVGGIGQVSALLAAAARKLVQTFEDGCDLPVSKSKGRVTASSMTLARDTAKRLRAVGCKAVRTMQILGIDTAAGRGGLGGGHVQRQSAMAKRAKRLIILKKAGAGIRDVLQAAVVGGTTYGSRVIGLAPGVLRNSKRTMTLALPGRAKSASVQLKFATSDKPHLDPTFAAYNGPIFFWAKLAFGADEEVRAEMQRAWQRQVHRLHNSGKPWQAVAGPAGAITMVMKQLG
jgi:hypothetical protein